MGRRHNGGLGAIPFYLTSLAEYLLGAEGSYERQIACLKSEAMSKILAEGWVLNAVKRCIYLAILL